MTWLISAGKYIMEHWQLILNAAIALLTGLVAVFMLIPGEQPEKALRGIADFIEKFSRKPKE